MHILEEALALQKQLFDIPKELQGTMPDHLRSYYSPEQLSRLSNRLSSFKDALEQLLRLEQQRTQLLSMDATSSSSSSSGEDNECKQISELLSILSPIVVGSRVGYETEEWICRLLELGRLIEDGKNCLGKMKDWVQKHSANVHGQGLRAPPTLHSSSEPSEEARNLMAAILKWYISLCEVWQSLKL